MNKYALILLLTLCACQREDIGDLKDVFSCTIQGESFFPRKIASGFLAVSLTTTKDEDHNSFSITAINNSKRYMSVRIDVNTGSEFLQEKEYNLTKIDLDNLKESTRAKCHFQKGGGNTIQFVDESTYHTTNENPGTVIITEIDTINKNIQGSFQFEAINKFGEMITITNGTINVKYLD